MPLPEDAQQRKSIPLYSGVFSYFPDALAEVAKVSKKGNEQHHPDKPLHWDKSKSTDHLDALLRHIIDEDWGAVAWRALAHLQTEIDSAGYDVRQLELDLGPKVQIPEAKMPGEGGDWADLERMEVFKREAF